MSKQDWLIAAVVVGAVALVTLYGAVRLARRVFAVRRQLGPLGAGGKLAFYGSLIYAIFPVDLLPDPIYLDDMAVLGGGLLYLTKLLRDRRARRLPGTLPPDRRAQLPRRPGQNASGVSNLR